MEKQIWHRSTLGHLVRVGLQPWGRNSTRNRKKRKREYKIVQACFGRRTLQVLLKIQEARIHPILGKGKAFLFARMEGGERSYPSVKGSDQLKKGKEGGERDGRRTCRSKFSQTHAERYDLPSLEKKEHNKCADWRCERK